MTAYNPDRFIPDSSGDGPLGVDAHRVPVPPVEWGWGPGMLVRLPERRGWQWVPPPDPRDRWEPAQPPATSDQPIAIGRWFPSLDECTVRLRADRTSFGVETEGPPTISLRIGICDVVAWREARPKDGPGLLSLDIAQAAYLRDALTAMLERVK